MQNLIYSFWCAPLKESWQKYPNVKSYDELFNKTVNTIHLSILYAHKFGFKIRVYTDHESAYLFKNLPVDQINTDLSFLAYKNTYIEGKMYAISKQNEPFVYIDWDVFLIKNDVAQLIKTFKEDVLIQSYNKLSASNEAVNEEAVLKIQHCIDFSPFLVENFYKKSSFYPNTAVLGFNNLKVRDLYVNNFLKCLTVVRNHELTGFSEIIDKYLLYSVVDYTGASSRSLFDKGSDIEQRAAKLGFTHLSGESKYSSKNQLKISERLKKEFPEYSGRLSKKQFKNNVLLSLCTVVMNRFDHVIHTLKKNVAIASTFDGRVDVNVLDYNSKDGLEAYLFKQNWFMEAVENKILKYYKNYDAEHYHRTLPKNIVHYLAKGEFLVNVDADNYLSKDYLNYCLSLIKTENNFFLRPAIVNITGSFGRILVHRDDFKNICGYNLNIKNYGFEDCEITLRLKSLGVRQLTTPNSLRLQCISHSNKIRLSNEERFFIDGRVVDHPYISDYINKHANIYKPVDQEMYDIKLFDLSNLNGQATRVDLQFLYNNLHNFSL